MHADPSRPCNTVEGLKVSLVCGEQKTQIEMSMRRLGMALINVVNIDVDQAMGLQSGDSTLLFDLTLGSVDRGRVDRLEMSPRLKPFPNLDVIDQNDL